MGKWSKPYPPTFILPGTCRAASLAFKFCHNFLDKVGSFQTTDIYGFVPDMFDANCCLKSPRDMPGRVENCECFLLKQLKALQMQKGAGNLMHKGQSQK